MDVGFFFFVGRCLVLADPRIREDGMSERWEKTKVKDQRDREGSEVPRARGETENKGATYPRILGSEDLNISAGLPYRESSKLPPKPIVALSARDTSFFFLSSLFL